MGNHEPEAGLNKTPTLELSKNQVVKRILLKTLLAGGLVALFVWLVDFRGFLKYFNQRLLADILIIQPLVLASLLPLGGRYVRLIEAPWSGFPACFKAVTLAVGLNNILPLHMSQVVKATYVNQNAGAPYSVALSALFVERVADLAALCCVALWGASMLFSPLFNGALAAGVLGVLVLFIAGFPLLSRMAARYAERLPWEGPRLFATGALRHTRSQLETGKITISILLSLLAMLTSVAGIALFMYIHDGCALGLAGVVNLYAATTLFGAALPSLPGGFGTYEAAAIVILRWFGYEMDEAAALAVGLHLSQICLFFLMALGIAVRERIGVLELMKQLWTSRPGQRKEGPET